MPQTLKTATEIRDMARHAGLDLSPKHLDELLQVYPHVEAMLHRLDRDHGYLVEPAVIFAPASLPRAP